MLSNYRSIELLFKLGPGIVNLAWLESVLFDVLAPFMSLGTMLVAVFKEHVCNDLDEFVYF